MFHSTDRELTQLIARKVIMLRLALVPELAGVKVATWASVLAEVMDDWRSEHGMELGGVLGPHTSYRWVYNSFVQAQVAK